MNRLNITAVSICLVAMLFAVPSHALAGTITYSWVGRIFPEKADEDPWDIGAEKPFFISATVSQNSLDVDQEVDGAFFESPEIVFLIDGEPPTSLGNEFGTGGLWFQDFASRDGISILLNDVRFNGVTEESLYTSVRLPVSTFTLANIVEVLPLFSPTTTIVGGGTGGVGSSYGTFMEVGVVVTATPIPEPSSIVLSLLALTVLGTRLFWRHVVCAR